MAKTPKPTAQIAETQAPQTNPIVNDETFPEPVAVVPTQELTPLDGLADVEQPLPTSEPEPADHMPQELDLNALKPAHLEDPDKVDASVKIARQDMGRQQFVQNIIDQRNKEREVPVYVPPPPTERQMSNRERELSAGRAAVAKHQAVIDSRPKQKPKPHPADGGNTEVLRPQSGEGSEDRNAARFRTSPPRNPA